MLQLTSTHFDKMTRGEEVGREESTRGDVQFLSAAGEREAKKERKEEKRVRKLAKHSPSGYVCTMRIVKGKEQNKCAREIGYSGLGKF